MPWLPEVFEIIDAEASCDKKHHWLELQDAPHDHHRSDFKFTEANYQWLEISEAEWEPQ